MSNIEITVAELKEEIVRGVAEFDSLAIVDEINFDQMSYRKRLNLQESKKAFTIPSNLNLYNCHFREPVYFGDQFITHLSLNGSTFDKGLWMNNISGFLIQCDGITCTYNFGLINSNIDTLSVDDSVFNDMLILKKNVPFDLYAKRMRSAVSSIEQQFKELYDDGAQYGRTTPVTLGEMGKPGFKKPALPLATA